MVNFDPSRSISAFFSSFRRFVLVFFKPINIQCELSNSAYEGLLSASCSCLSFSISLVFLSKTVVILARNSDFHLLINCWLVPYLFAISAKVLSSRRTSSTILAFSSGVQCFRLVVMFLFYLNFGILCPTT